MTEPTIEQLCAPLSATVPPKHCGWSDATTGSQRTATNSADPRKLTGTQRALAAWREQQKEKRK